MLCEVEEAIYRGNGIGYVLYVALHKRVENCTLFGLQIVCVNNLISGKGGGGETVWFERI